MMGIHNAFQVVAVHIAAADHVILCAEIRQKRSPLMNFIVFPGIKRQFNKTQFDHIRGCTDGVCLSDHPGQPFIGDTRQQLQ